MRQMAVALKQQLTGLFQGATVDGEAGAAMRPPQGPSGISAVAERWRRGRM
jgi:hypothetical protein